MQCRLSKTVVDLYVDALADLDIRLELSTIISGAIKGKITGKGEFGWKLLAKASVDVETEIEAGRSVTNEKVGHDVEDLRFIAELIKASGKAACD